MQKKKLDLISWFLTVICMTEKNPIRSVIVLQTQSNDTDEILLQITQNVIWETIQVRNHIYCPITQLCRVSFGKTSKIFGRLRVNFGNLGLIVLLSSNNNRAMLLSVHITCCVILLCVFCNLSVSFYTDQ